MMNEILKNKNIYLRELTLDDVGVEYLSWVNDKEITRFLEIKYQNFTIDDLKDFITACQKNDSKVFWG